MFVGLLFCAMGHKINSTWPSISPKVYQDRFKGTTENLFRAEIKCCKSNGYCAFVINYVFYRLNVYTLLAISDLFHFIFFICGLSVSVGFFIFLFFFFLVCL